MIIGIDARMYGPTNSGLGRYVEQLIASLASLDTSHEFVVFLKQDAFDSFVLPNARWRKVLADVHWYGLAEQWKMPGIIKKAGVDRMHFPHWNVPVLYRGPFVVTIHDLIMFHFPRRDASRHGWLVYTLKHLVHRVLVKYVAHRARHICTTSFFTKRDIVTTLGVQEQRISVIYQAPARGASLTSATSSGSSEVHIDSPYVLYVGNAYPHKNLDRLLDAWSLFSSEHPAYRLVLVGNPSPWYDRLKQRASGMPSVVITGYLSDTEVASLYRRAHLYVFPSLYEGFGLPPLEAMQYGIPVVASSASCLPEVLGNAALYVDPYSVDDMVRGLGEGTENGEIRYLLRQNIPEELARFSSSTFAQETLRVYTSE